jgi:acyl dehydratase
MVDSAALGHTGEPFTIEIERGKIREFAVATHSSNSDYLEVAEPVVPPTFLTTTAFWATGDADAWQAVAMDQARGLHAEQEYVFHGPPPRAGAKLRARSRITDIYAKQGRRGGTLTFAVMRTDFHDPQGRLIAEAKLTGVQTAAPLDTPAADLGASRVSGSPITQPAPRSAGNELVVGPLTRTDLVRYQGASGDFNPLHHDEPFARAAGFDRPLSLGMLQAGLLATWATDRFGAEAVRRFRVRFAEQVFPGDTATCSGEVVKSYVEDGEPRLDLELVCTTQTGAVAVRGWATFAGEEQG